METFKYILTTLWRAGDVCQPLLLSDFGGTIVGNRWLFPDFGAVSPFSRARLSLDGVTLLYAFDVAVLDLPTSLSTVYIAAKRQGTRFNVLEDGDKGFGGRSKS